ncbi:Gfo/Idh/MocA family oxidoreductase [Roseburia hominis]
MKICFIGIGSIAKRHISNLKEIAEEHGFALLVDAVRRSNSWDLDIGIDTVYHSTDDLPGNYDAIFITNPTDFHLDTLFEVNGKASNFFIEKPVTSVRKLQQAENLCIREDNLYYVACPLRYTNVIQYLKTFVKENRVIGVRCISSSYLPEWRPGIDYRDTYSSHKELGGGVSIDLIHEWDYLKYLFGMPTDVIYKSGKKSNLELNCEDTALYIAEYADKFVELHLDYFGRKTIREVMLFTEDDTVVGDLVSGKITFMKSGKVINFGDHRNDFQKRELIHFLELMKIGDSDNSIQDAINTMKLTQGWAGDR